MGKIDELIKQLCPDGVKSVILGEVCKTLKKGTLKTTELVEGGEYPVINSGRDWYGFYDNFNNLGNAITIAARGEYAGFVTYVKEPFWAGGLCYPYRSVDENILITKFLFYVLKNKERENMDKLVARGSIPALNKGSFEKIEIPLPPLAVQKEIAEVLDTFTGMIDNLQKELEQRQKQFEYYRKSLLCKKDGTAQKVKEFAELKAGKAIKASELSETQDKSHLFPCFGGNGIRGYIEKKSHFGDYAIIGRQGALCGCVNWAQNYFYATEHAVVVTPKGQNNSRFLYYLFCEADLNQYKSQGAQPGLAVTNLNELQYYIPSLDKQQEIVDKLDTFEALISNIKQEIELRQKQYKYYREKLLTFE